MSAEFVSLLFLLAGAVLLCVGTVRQGVTDLRKYAGLAARFRPVVIKDLRSS